MSNNTYIVEELENLKAKVKEDKYTSLVTRNIQDVYLNHDTDKTFLCIGDKILQKNAIKNIANKFKIKPEFFQLGKELGNSEIDDITNKLKSLRNQDILVEEKNESIENVFFEYPVKKRKDTSNLSIIDNIDRIIGEVKSSTLEFTKNNISYANNIVNIELLTDTNIEVLQNDPWKIGIQSDFSRTHYNINPFLLRRVCANGMVAPQYGFNSNIEQMKWNREKIEEITKTIFLNPQDEMKEIIIRNVQLLKRNTISISEYNKTKNNFLEQLEEEQAIPLISKYFNSDFTKYYGLDLDLKSNQFLKTADTNINAYDHFNNITWITSHLNETKLNEKDALKLNVHAANFLFNADKLDLSQIAPKVNFN